MRTLVLLLLFVLALAPACDETTATPAGDVLDGTTGFDPDATSPYLPDTTTQDASDVEEDVAEVIYPGHECQRDDQCSTGLCYGKATSQGFFEPTLCQTRCIAIEDLTKYCTGNSDCCAGVCCRGCGWREGLCVTE